MGYVVVPIFKIAKQFQVGHITMNAKKAVQFVPLWPFYSYYKKNRGNQLNAGTDPHF